MSEADDEDDEDDNGRLVIDESPRSPVLPSPQPEEDDDDDEEVEWTYYLAYYQRSLAEYINLLLPREPCRACPSSSSIMNGITISSINIIVSIIIVIPAPHQHHHHHVQQRPWPGCVNLVHTVIIITVLQSLFYLPINIYHKLVLISTCHFHNE